MRCGCIILWTRVFFNSIVWQCCQTWLSCHVSGSLAKFSGEHVELRLVSSIFSFTLTSSTLWAILLRWYDEPTVTSSDSSSDSGATCSSQGAEFHFESATGISSSIPYPASPATPSIPSTAIHSTSTSDHISCSRTTNSDDSDIQPTCFQCTLQPRRHAETDEGHSRIHHESCRGEEPGKTQIFHRCQLIHQLPAILLHQLSSHLQCQLHIVVPDHTTTDLCLTDRTNVRCPFLAVPVERDPSDEHIVHQSHDPYQGEEDLHPDLAAEPPRSLFARHPRDIETDQIDAMKNKMSIIPPIPRPISNQPNGITTNHNQLPSQPLIHNQPTTTNTTQPSGNPGANGRTTKSPMVQNTLQGGLTTLLHHSTTIHLTTTLPDRYITAFSSNYHHSQHHSRRQSHRSGSIQSRTSTTVPPGHVAIDLHAGSTKNWARAVKFALDHPDRMRAAHEIPSSEIPRPSTTIEEEQYTKACDQTGKLDLSQEPSTVWIAYVRCVFPWKTSGKQWQHNPTVGRTWSPWFSWQEGKRPTNHHRGDVPWCLWAHCIQSWR